MIIFHPPTPKQTFYNFFTRTKNISNALAHTTKHTTRIFKASTLMRVVGERSTVPLQNKTTRTRVEMKRENMQLKPQSISASTISHSSRTPFHPARMIVFFLTRVRVRAGARFILGNLMRRNSPKASPALNLPFHKTLICRATGTRVLSLSLSSRNV